MASDTFKSILVGLVLFVLFSSLVLTVAIDFGAEYDRDASEIGGGSLNLSIFQTSAESIEGSSSAYRERFESGDVDDIDDPSGLFAVTITSVFSFSGFALESSRAVIVRIATNTYKHRVLPLCNILSVLSDLLNHNDSDAADDGC